MAEWLKAAVLKTVSGVTRSGVRIPLPPPEPSETSIAFRGAVERAQDAARRGIEALGRLDAASREIDGAPGHLASLVAEKVAGNDVFERGRENDWRRQTALYSQDYVRARPQQRPAHSNSGIVTPEIERGGQGGRSNFGMGSSAWHLTSAME